MTNNSIDYKKLFEEEQKQRKIEQQRRERAELGQQEEQ